MNEAWSRASRRRLQATRNWFKNYRINVRNSAKLSHRELRLLSELRDVEGYILFDRALCRKLMKILIKYVSISPLRWTCYNSRIIREFKTTSRKWKCFWTWSELVKFRRIFVTNWRYLMSSSTTIRPIQRNTLARGRDSLRVPSFRNN